MSSTATQPNIELGSAKVKKQRGPWLAGGAALVGIALVLSLLTYSRLSATTQYLALVNDVSAGSIITRADVGLVNLRLDTPEVRLLTPDQFESVIEGRRALTDLASNTLLTPDLVVEGVALDSDEALLGFYIEGGIYPTANLQVGDHVAMIALPESSIGQEEFIPFEVSRGTVHSFVGSGDTTYRLFMSVRIPVADAAFASHLAAEDRVIMVQIANLDAPPVITPEVIERFASYRAALAAGDDNVDASNPDFDFGTGAANVNSGAVETGFVQVGNQVVVLRPQADVTIPEDAEVVYFDADFDGIDDTTGDAIPAELVALYAPADEEAATEG